MAAPYSISTLERLKKIGPGRGNKTAKVWLPLMSRDGTPMADDDLSSLVVPTSKIVNIERTRYLSPLVDRSLGVRAASELSLSDRAACLSAFSSCLWRSSSCL